MEVCVGMIRNPTNFAEVVEVYTGENEEKAENEVKEEKALEDEEKGMDKEARGRTFRLWPLLCQLGGSSSRCFCFL